MASTWALPATLSLAQLRAHARSAGLGQTGTKTALAQALAAQADTLRILEPLARVVSVDLGYRNLAFAVTTADGAIAEWRRVAVSLPEHLDPAGYANALHAFVGEHWAGLVARTDTLFLLERQRHRPMRGALTPEHIVKVNAIELQLCCILRTQAVSVQPRAVATHWGLPAGAAKKRAAVALVHKMPLPADLVLRFRAETKRDDMADCLLQARAFWDWRQHLIGLFKP